MKQVLSSLLILSGCLAAAKARADTDEDWLPPARRAESGPSPGLALALSVAGTALPLYLAARISDASEHNSNQGPIYGLVLGGTLLGPSTGQFYAGSWGRGLAGMGVRTLGLVILATGAGRAMESGCPMDFGGNSECEEKDENKGSGAMVLGTLLFLGGIVYSAVDAPLAAKRWHRDRESSVEWVPALELTRDGSWKPGLRASIRF